MKRTVKVVEDFGCDADEPALGALRVQVDDSITKIKAGLMRYSIIRQFLTFHLLVYLFPFWNHLWKQKVAWFLSNDPRHGRLGFYNL